MTSNTIKRYGNIARGTNTDASDDYYSLFPAFAAQLLEVMCRHHKGKTYKVIICPCDSATSIFNELVKYKHLIGDPQLVYSHWPEKDWKDYFDMDYEKEYGCKAEDVLIFTNPPFKGLSKELPTIKCDYLLFGSNAVGFMGNTHAKETHGYIYLKNNVDFDGNADNRSSDYGRVCTYFYANREFESAGKQFINKTKQKESIMFGKDRLKCIKV